MKFHLSYPPSSENETAELFYFTSIIEKGCGGYQIQNTKKKRREPSAPDKAFQLYNQKLLAFINPSREKRLRSAV